MFVAKNAVMTSFASGRATSLVLKSGGGQSIAVPVNEGFAMRQRESPARQTWADACGQRDDATLSNLPVSHLVDPVPGMPCGGRRRKGAGIALEDGADTACRAREPCPAFSARIWLMTAHRHRCCDIKSGRLGDVTAAAECAEGSRECRDCTAPASDFIDNEERSDLRPGHQQLS